MSEQPARQPDEHGGAPQAPRYGQQPTEPQGYGQQPPGAQGYPQQGQGHPRPGYAPAGEMSPADQRLWACLAHVSAIVAGVVLTPATGGTVYLGVIGPLVLYFVFRERGVFVRRQTVEALNFQILVTAVALAVLLLSIVLGIITFGLALLLIVPLALAVGVAALVLEIIAAVKANQGVDHRYPVSWRLVR